MTAMTRRAALAGTAALTLAGCGTISPAAPPEKKTYLFVPGTWHGAWMWTPMRRLMERQGHRVIAMTLTGVGDRAHLARPDVGLETHITDIVNVMDYEELDRVILVGHSFSGVAITGAADRRREKIRRLVYFDALIPAPGRMAAVRREADGRYMDYFAKRMPKFIDGYLMDFFQDYPIEMLVPKEDAATQAILKRKITPHPMRGWTDVLELKNGGYEGLPKSYIHCSGQVHSPSSNLMSGPARDNPAWDWIDFPYHRDAALTHPAETAKLMMSLS